MPSHWLDSNSPHVTSSNSDMSALGSHWHTQLWQLLGPGGTHDFSLHKVWPKTQQSLFLLQHSFPALFFTSPSLHPLVSVMATHQMGPWTEVVAMAPAPLQPSVCLRDPGPGKGQGQPLPQLTPAQPEGSQR